MLTTSSSPTHDQVAKALGIDLGRIDWQKLFAIIQAILAILAQQKQKAQTAGCSEHDCRCHEAAEHALTAACLSLQCCEKAT